MAVLTLGIYEHKLSQLLAVVGCKYRTSHYS